MGEKCSKIQDERRKEAKGKLAFTLKNKTSAARKISKNQGRSVAKYKISEAKVNWRLR
jgi:hypothetical protein